MNLDIQRSDIYTYYFTFLQTFRRQQIDQDAREIRILTEQFIEEEDDGHERERKFRWKTLNNTDMNDQSQSADQDPENSQIGSDDENEEEWRRQRYEREQKLKEQTEKSTMVISNVLKMIHCQPN